MAAKSKAEVLKFYEELRSPTWELLEALRVFLPRLFRERDLTGCTFFTSLATLCIVRYPTYHEWCDKPVLTINCTTKDILRFEFRITMASDPVYRALTESVNCPLELGLEEFDRMYTKFLDAHKDDWPTADASDDRKMSPQERWILQCLDTLLHAVTVRARIDPIVERVQRKL